MSDSGSRPRLAPPTVAVFGGGISGLTAAHELVERGFRVVVYEPTPPRSDGRVCEIGGMAATQWSRVLPSMLERAQSVEEPPLQRTEPPLPQAVYRHFNQPMPVPVVEGDAYGEPEALAELVAAIAPYWGAAGEDVGGRRTRIERLRILGYGAFEGVEPPTRVADDRVPRGTREDLDVALRVRDLLRVRLGEATDERFEVRGMGPGYALDACRTPAQRRHVVVQPIEDLVPGEHGFRFFPSFYRHVFDTMLRIPLARPGSPFVETRYTVADNIVPTFQQGMGFEARGADGEPRPDGHQAEAGNTFVFPRRRLTTLREVFEEQRKVLDRAGYSLEDVSRLLQRLFVYLTSCEGRRRGYADASWWEFMRGEQFSPRFQVHLETGPQLLVGMTATRGDARTIGDVAAQLLMDQIDPGRRTDGTLKGPTTLAWLDPWRAYLEHQGVHFVRGALAELRLRPMPDAAGRPRREIVPFVDVEEDPFAPPDDGAVGRGAARDRPMRTPVLFDYAVIAVPPHVARRLVQGLVEEAAQAHGLAIGGTRDVHAALAELARREPALGHRDLQAILELDVEAADACSPEVRGDVDHLSGLQLYFETDVSLVRGHTIYADSAWGLSSISQPQFWTRRRGPWDGYRGILSVDIGNFRERDQGGDGEPPRRAWDCTPDQLAHGVWRQILATARRPDRVPRPWFYHLDDNLEFGATGIARNGTLFLTNRPGRYERRPGRPGAYELVGGRLVFAGNFMQTYTRMTTMESANESARHAVNAILAVEREGRPSRGEPCGIWRPIDFEPPELRTLRELDDLLWQAGEPHFLDILDGAGSPEAWLSGDPLAAVAEGLGALRDRLLADSRRGGRDRRRARQEDR